MFRTIARVKGVYALCDLDKTVIYVGQSKGAEGIGGRSRRYVTSARADAVANRGLDVWEVSYIRAWPAQEEFLDELEANLMHHYNKISPVLNLKLCPQLPSLAGFAPSQCTETQILPDDEIQRRKDPQTRLARQVNQIASLLDWTIHVKDTADVRRVLSHHFARLNRHYKALVASQAPEPEDADSD